MKGYRILFIIFLALLTVYVVAELNRPRPLNWTVTLRKDDKQPFGCFVLFKEFKQIFPQSPIEAFREPAYNTLHNKDLKGTAYAIISPTVNLGETDFDELLNYAVAGNEVFIASSDISSNLLDTLGLEVTHVYFDPLGDSTSFNFVNPALKAPDNYTSSAGYMSDYFSVINKRDSTVVLGINRKKFPNFVKVSYGKGAFYIHASPLCFSNYFMLINNNADYVAKALSYLKPEATKIIWDEYYKSGREGASTPLRFFLSNIYLQWALWITVTGFLLYIVFEMKRRQRIIPVIEAPRNTSMEFVQTVATVYLAQKNNYTIASKKILFWFDFLRRNYFLVTTLLDEAFIAQVSRKSGIDKTLIEDIIRYHQYIQRNKFINDQELLSLNAAIDQFYEQTKK